jgi:hypothetical protein
MLPGNSRSLAELFNLSKQDGRLVLAKGERIIGIILAPVLIVFFSHARTGLLGMMGRGWVDVAVRIFLEEMFISFTLCVGLAFIWCLIRPRWIERLLEVSTRKLVLVLQVILTAPYLILIAAAVFNLLHH